MNINFDETNIFIIWRSANIFNAKNFERCGQILLNQKEFEECEMCTYVRNHYSY